MDLSILDAFVIFCCFASLILPIRIAIDSYNEIQSRDKETQQ